MYSATAGCAGVVVCTVVALALEGAVWLVTVPEATPMAMAKAMAVPPMAVRSARGVMGCSFLIVSWSGCVDLFPR